MVPMATLYVRDMPDDLYARLRDEARGSRRSIGAAAIEILQGELRERDELTVDELLERARKVRARAARPATVSVADEIRADRQR
jgi:antitoxin FitA